MNGSHNWLVSVWKDSKLPFRLGLELCCCYDLKSRRLKVNIGPTFVVEVVWTLEPLRISSAGIVKNLKGDARLPYKRKQIAAIWAVTSRVLMWLREMLLSFCWTNIWTFWNLSSWCLVKIRYVTWKVSGVLAFPTFFGNLVSESRCAAWERVAHMILHFEKVCFRLKCRVIGNHYQESPTWLLRNIEISLPG